MRVQNLARSVSLAGVIAAMGVAPVLLSTQANAEDEIEVGVVLPITSVLAPYGKPFVDALEMAVADANAAGGIDGRKIELVVEDSQASNTVAINAINKVMRGDPVAVFGPALGTQILAIMPTTEQAKVPLIAGPSTRKVTQQGADYFFRNSTHDAIAKENWTRYLVEDLGKKKIGILHVANEWGYSGRDNTAGFLKELYGLEPVSIASYQPTDKDLTAPILQMVNAGADAIVSQGHPVDEALLVKQMKQLGVDVPHIASGSLCVSVLRGLVSAEEVAGHYCEGPDVIPSLSEKPAVQAWVKAYKEKTGFEPDIYATHYYDAMNMLIQVMRQQGADREKIRDGLRDASYEGVIGTYKADEEGNLWHNAAIMKFLPDGKIEVVRRYSN
ncbi:MAG: ABC transporter substrate-binding protein [Sneathiellaceae bacterium]